MKDSPGFDSGVAIRIGEKALDPNETRWGLLLLIFMRLVSALWILQGLMQWQIVLTVDSRQFQTAPNAVAGVIVLFAVLDLIAAVGLWLAAPWGGVLWLLVTLAQIVVAVAMPGFFASGVAVVLLDVLLIAIYIVLTYMAGRDPERHRPPRRAL